MNSKIGTIPVGVKLTRESEMKKNVMVMVAVSGLSITSFGGENEVAELMVNKALENGGIAIMSAETVTITPDVMEIVKEIAKSKKPFKVPVLIFLKDEIEIKDKKTFEDMMLKPGQTITSA